MKLLLFTKNTLLLFFLCLSSTLFSQLNYKVDGTVKENGKALQGATVTVTNFNGDKIKEFLTQATGSFSVPLKPDEEYTILVSKEGYTTIKLLYSTIGMTESEAKQVKGNSAPEITIFPLPQDAKLLAKVKNMENKPLVSYYYSSEDKKMIGDDEDYQERLAEIAKLEQEVFEEKNKDAIAAQKEAKYKAEMEKGDKEMIALNYKAAKDAYTEASSAKPSDPLAKEKIAQCNKLIGELEQKDKQAKEKEINDKYNAAITKADKAFASRDYNGAKLAYNEAATLKITEQYPKDKIKEIENLVADAAAKDKADKDKLAKDKEANDKYNAAIAKADAAFFAKNYEAAKTAYNEAMTVKPNEAYPKNKIVEADKLIAETAQKDKDAKEKDINDKYAAAIAKADKYLAAKDYKAAKVAYIDANSIKPKEQYPKDKMVEIDKIIAENEAKEKAEAEKIAKEKERLAKEKEINDKYTAAIAKADAAFMAKKYADAKVAYNEALSIKTNEAQPKAKITECDKLAAEAEKLAKEKAAADAAEKERLAKEAEKRAFEKKYANTIAKADSLMNSKNYDKAKTVYSEAIQLKPEETYPKEQIKKADVLIAEVELYKNDLAKKYPQGVTEEIVKEGNTKITKRIVVAGNKGYLYEKKETGFGATYYFKDGISISEQDFNKYTEVKK